MAKVVGPLMSVDARGKIADAMVFMGWKGIKSVRTWLKPKNPRTSSQLVIRNIFAIAVNKHHMLAGADKVAWAKRTTGLPLSGFNLFMKKVIDVLFATKTWALLKNINASAILTTTATIEGNIDNIALVKIKYGTQSRMYPYEKEEAVGRTIAGNWTVSLTGLVTKTKYFYTVVLKTPNNTIGESGEYEFTTA